MNSTPNQNVVNQLGRLECFGINVALGIENPSVAWRKCQHLGRAVNRINLADAVNKTYRKLSTSAAKIE
jgi:hypothetical protein